MAAVPRSWRRKRVKFPDPVAQAQVMFTDRPEDMMRAYSSNQSFLESSADYKNMMSGADYSNQRLFQTVTNKLTETDFRNMLPITGNVEEDEKRMKKLALLLEKVGGPAIEQVKAALSNSIMDTVKPELTNLQKQVDQVTGKPVQISNDLIDEVFGKSDQREVPLFEVTFDGYEYGKMGIFTELGSTSYLKLLPQDADYKSAISAVNELNVEKSFMLTDKFCEVLASDMITDNTALRDNYLAIIHHTIGDKLGDAINRYRTGIEPGSHTGDKHMVKAVKLDAAKQLQEWLTKSIKFRKWIAPLHLVNAVEVEELIKSAESESVEAAKSTEAAKPAEQPVVMTTPSTPRMQLRSDTRKQEGSEFATPKPGKPDKPGKSDYGLSPEGKKELAEIMKATGKSKQQIKAEIIAKARADPENLGDFIVKKGGQVKTIVVPPSKLARFDRIKVILGAITADSTADYLEEYTAIVDSLLKDEMITKDQHKFLIKKYCM